MLEVAEEGDEQVLGRLLLTASKVAKQVGLTEGYRVVINNGEQVQIAAHCVEPLKVFQTIIRHFLPTNFIFFLPALIYVTAF